MGFVAAIPQLCGETGRVENCKTRDPLFLSKSQSTQDRDWLIVIKYQK